MKIKPIGERVLVKVIEMESKTQGGILLPDSAKEKTQKAQVLAIGESDKIKVKENDVIIYDKYAGNELELEGEKLLLLDYKDVIAKIQE
jgi:chaperonin GroES